MISNLQLIHHYKLYKYFHIIYMYYHQYRQINQLHNLHRKNLKQLLKIFLNCSQYKLLELYILYKSNHKYCIFLQQNQHKNQLDKFEHILKYLILNKYFKDKQCRIKLQLLHNQSKKHHKLNIHDQHYYHIFQLGINQRIHLLMKRKTFHCHRNYNLLIILHCMLSMKYDILCNYNHCYLDNNLMHMYLYNYLIININCFDKSSIHFRHCLCRSNNFRSKLYINCH